MAIPRHCLSRPTKRSTTLRLAQRAASKSGRRPWRVDLRSYSDLDARGSCAGCHAAADACGRLGSYNPDRLGGGPGGCADAPRLLGAPRSTPAPPSAAYGPASDLKCHPCANGRSARSRSATGRGVRADRVMAPRCVTSKGSHSRCRDGPAIAYRVVPFSGKRGTIRSHASSVSSPA